MDFIEIIKSFIIGIIQGITEWLPISSTGHMILANEFIKMNMSEEFMNMFLVVIQFGAIMAVILLFFKKLNPLSLKKTSVERKETIFLWLKVCVGSIPAGIIGFLFNDKIDELFYNYKTVALTLALYGVLFILVENRTKDKAFNCTDIHQLTYKTAFIIGIFQLLALIPGTSRSGATIIGAMFIGTSRAVAAEFSFFLSIPVMICASGYKLVKFGFDFTATELAVLLTGMIVAFVVSILAIKFLLGYIKKHDFKVFGYYRIILGIIVLLYFMIVK